MYTSSSLRFLVLLSSLISPLHAHSTGDEQAPAEPAADFLTEHMDKEHHIQNQLSITRFELGQHPRSLRDTQTVWVDHHNSVASRILGEVMDKIDLNKDGLITKSEFVSVVSIHGLPTFNDISGLGHHYDEEGEYFLHQQESAYIHPEDIRHFSHHEELEIKEDELSRIAQGLPADMNTLEYRRQRQKHSLIEDERQRRVDAVKAQAAKYSSIHDEAQRRGSWAGFKKPVDQADRLRKNIPYKYKLKKPFFGEF
ncbi:hypothetical protein PSHT_05746 [Puccinia striiformis]|uniref:EF-hand domain-containing protein n=1 Tax=Puccinia striiformis TaxID=27350 RepID=A0A2S4W9N9_9BASI|nr:hypothetical protein PSHT_05746 [Puccinia striiformis]